MIAAALEDSHADWLEDAVATIHALAHAHPAITADWLRKEMRTPPHPNLVGIAFTTAKRLGYIEAVSHSISTARSRKNGSLRTWAAIKEDS
ncbi:hypothetical protein [Pseudarthrobacter sp. S6]|uniref:hypothetical protein n=1 Tax=Pseudarthrobacter sp. S6 TaxID=3418420 RepID=UPI003CE794EF